MTRAYFDQQMLRMVGLSFPPTNLALENTFEVVSSWDETLFERAVTRARETRKTYPTVAELREDYIAAMRNRDAQRGVSTPEPWYDCDVCQDTGWRPFWCGPQLATSELDPRHSIEQRTCGRRRHPDNTYPHEWRQPCECAQSNPTIQRHRMHYAATARTATTS